jgi:hypothetical protein
LSLFKAWNSGDTGLNFMRQYYDIYNLLGREDVQAFIATPEYQAHKEDRFPNPDFSVPINKNEAFLLSDQALRESFRKRYTDTAALYYNGQPDFDKLLARIHEYVDQL